MDASDTTHGVKSGNKVGVSTNQKRDGIVYTYVLSCCAATVAESVTYPLDLTKTRLQIQGEGGSLLGKNPSVPQVQYRGMIRTAYGIAREEGLQKLWQGAPPAIYRHLVYTGCRIGLYEWIRESILGRNADGTYTFWKALLSGLLAGGIAQFVASPTDLVKIQMQMEGRRRLEGHAPRVKNTWHAFSRIFQEGGIRGLWKGWVPNVQRAALVNLGELTTYDTVKHHILIYTKLEDKPLTHALSSVCSGLVAATVGTPADVVKTRFMNQAIKDGKGVLYKSSLDCLVKTVSHEGLFALYKGFLPTWARMAPWSFTFWLTYEQIRRLAGASSF